MQLLSPRIAKRFTNWNYPAFYPIKETKLFIICYILFQIDFFCAKIIDKATLIGYDL